MWSTHKIVVKLSPCQKDIKNHLRSLKLAVGGECGGLISNIPNNIETEADLCRRVGFFLQRCCLLLYALYIVTRLGVHYRQGKTCSHPQHTWKGKTFRGRYSFHIQRILENYDDLLPVGNNMLTIIYFFNSYNHKIKF